MSKNNIFHVYFGVPGSGKTTMAAKLTQKYLKRGEKVYSNVPILGAYKIDVLEDIGTYSVSDGLLIIDEAGVEYNNRQYKSMSYKTIKFYKYHRHFNIDVVVFSQAYDDMDITLRRLATRFHLLKKSIIPYFIAKRSIVKCIGINPETRQLEDWYDWKFLSRRWYFMPTVWKMFKTDTRYELPVKKFVKYEEIE